MMPPNPENRLPVPRRLRSLREVSLGFEERSGREEGRRCPQCRRPPCEPACPLGVDITGFIRSLREGDFRAALDRIRRRNDWPGVCGRICPAPCEPACILGVEGASVRIRLLERLAFDKGRRRGLFRAGRRVSRRGPRVAVVGAGLGGLTAAAGLARGGCRVTVFEARPRAGGRLRFGVAPFRLPDEVLDEEIRAMVEEGVTLYSCRLIGGGPPDPLETLRDEGFAAVVLSCGDGGPVLDGLPGADAAGVFFTDEVLESARSAGLRVLTTDARRGLGGRVVVAGSDPAALDCARLAVRAGSRVTVLDVLGEEGAVERRWAEEEGVAFEPTVRPEAVVVDEEGRAAGVRCRRMDYADPEGDGHWRLVPVPDGVEILEADTVILSAKRRPYRRAAFMFSSLRRRRDGSIRTNETGETSVPGVYVCGGMRRPGMGLLETIGEARVTAGEVLAFLERGGALR